MVPAGRGASVVATQLQRETAAQAIEEVKGRAFGAVMTLSDEFLQTATAPCICGQPCTLGGNALDYGSYPSRGLCNSNKYLVEK